MRVRVAVSLVVQTPVRAHSLRCQLADKLPDGFYLFLAAHLARKRNLKLTPQLRILIFFNLVYCVPKRTPVGI